MKPRIPNHFVRTLGPLTSAVFLTATAASHGQTSTWGGATSSDWTVAGNWTLNPPAYGATVTGRLNINNATANPAIYDPVAQGAGAAVTTFNSVEASQIRGLVIGSTTSGSLVVNSGSLVFGGTDNPVMTNAGGSGALTINGGTVNLIANTKDFNLVYGSSVGSASVLTMNGGSFLGNGFNLTSSANNGTATLQLSGGTFAVNSLSRTGGGGTSTTAINFNGGTLQARAASTVFLPALINTTATVQTGGAKIDTQAFNITVAAPLLHDPALGATLDGGLTKNGSGTLTLSGTSTYTGPTAINAGSLVLSTTGNLPSSALTLAAGTNLQLESAGKAFGSLTLGGGHALTLAAKQGAPITVSGALTVGGAASALTIIPTGPLPTGTVDLITAATGSGTATFTPTFPVGSRLAGTAAVTGNKLQLILTTGTADLVWNNGFGDSVWNLDTTANFKNDLVNDVFKVYDSVTFSDTIGAGSRNVAITSNVAPVVINVNNSAGDYVLDGPGTISGITPLIKTGSSKLTLATALTYSATGPITVGGTGTLDLGTRNLTTPTLILDGGTLTNGTVTLPAIDLRSGASSAVFAGAGTITKSTAGNVTLTGTSTSTGPVNITAGTLTLGSLAAIGTSPANIIGGTLAADLTYTTKAATNLNGGTLSLKRGTTFTVDLGLRFNSSSSTLTAYGTGANPILCGSDVNSPDLIVADTISSVIPAAIEVRTDGFGLAITTTGSGALTIDSGIGGTGNAIASLGMSGLWAGTDSGSLFKLGTGTLTLTGASTFTATLTRIGSSTIQAGTLVLSGGDDRLPATSAMYLGLGTTGAKMVLGGINQTLTGLKSVGTGASSVVGGSATASTLTLNTTNNYTFAGTIGGAGENEDNLALVKSGAGTLTLSGTNHYRGNTSVNGGVLALGTATLADASKVTIAPTAKLALNYTGTDTVEQLFIGINSLPAGVYGSTASGAANPDDTHFSGTGTITVLPPSGDYEAWATDEQLTPGNNGKSQDADDDGVNNFGEFAFAGEPLSNTPNPRIVQKITTVNSLPALTLTLPVRNGVSFSGNTDLASVGSVSGVYYRIQGSTDLVTWNTLKVAEVPANDTAAVQFGITTAPLGWTNRSFYLPNVTPANTAKSFLRAKASETP